ncbi:sugar nucleotide-binding protein [Wolbachia endosymbiont of Atemnus politus]|uniref:SDR family oxidoreductase n=1 Tax=Wolbachia endosymbiont of Atemnus politus TaxID=2682840 RepID=UPI00157453B2|nr:SDR family oxidoreductase [Wolbachia endosymbiont of Atemnus politus]NSX83101.1 sugar nucleotide-binding protein [Wolbachia endosymbiont of Atemnus politus]
MHLFCFGYGYVAKFLSKKLLSLGWKISGTSRNQDVQNVSLLNYDKVREDTFQDVTHVLVSIPPDGDDVLERYGHYFQNIKWLGYLSATSVYGDHAGDWVTEESETRPIESRGKSRLRSEKKWLNSKLPVHIFRLAGIYGPGRNVLVDLRLNKARNIQKEGHLFSRIHVEDISNILFSSMQNIKPSEIYNCADDLPATQSEVVTYAAKLLNVSIPEPTEVSLLPDYTQSFYLGSKKVSNAKIKRDLGISLIYPNYKVGLKMLKITYNGNP